MARLTLTLPNELYDAVAEEARLEGIATAAWLEWAARALACHQQCARAVAERRARGHEATAYEQEQEEWVA
jgi:hypothetical protein